MSGTEQPASQEQAQKVNGVKENSPVQKKIDSDKQPTQTSKVKSVIPKKMVAPTKPETTTPKKTELKKDTNTAKPAGKPPVAKPAGENKKSDGKTTTAVVKKLASDGKTNNVEKKICGWGKTSYYEC